MLDERNVRVHAWRMGLPSMAAILGVFVILGLAVQSVEAQARRPILDQSNTENLSSLLNGGSSVYEWQQGITAGVTGQLTRIDLFVGLLGSVGETGPTEVSVTLGAPWQSSVPVWTTTEILRKKGWHSFNLSNAKIFIVAGDEFTIGIQGQSNSEFNPGFGISYNDQYLGGELFLNGSFTETGNDLLFNTYVKP